jgi:hypothetical protein
MPVPDHIIFGSGIDNDAGVDYGFARGLTNDTDKLKLLKRRLDVFLISQIDGLATKDDKGGLLIWSPFPLTAITCVASETLGRLITSIDNLKKSGKNDNEISKIVTVDIFGRLDKKLSRQLTKDFKKEMATIWPKDDVKSIQSYAEIMYKYLRNSFNHGYRAKNVFLDHTVTDGWIIENGFLTINPYWLWGQFKKVYEDCFIEIMLDKPENKMRVNALVYFQELVS